MHTNIQCSYQCALKHNIKTQFEAEEASHLVQGVAKGRRCTSHEVRMEGHASAVNFLGKRALVLQVFNKLSNCVCGACITVEESTCSCWHLYFFSK